MDEGEGGGGGLRLGKKNSDKGVAGSGEVDYRTKSGTAWSHSFLNQKPWHPLSYPNQRRKWIAEQTHANRERRAEEVAREFAQEQEFFRQTALFSKKEKEKVEMMKAVSFMYVRPPGYNAESAKAAEVEDERKNTDQDNAAQDPSSTAPVTDAKLDKNHSERDKKARPKDVFGRPLPTEEEFGVLKNAPRLETGMPARVKPFGIEIRNVRCVRCGTFGHQSGDRECPLKDVIMPNEESRLKRDDPLTAIIAQTDPNEPLKWELKQKPGLSPPRGGFQADDPNQQIVAEEIFDEYGGFLSGDIPELLTNFSAKKPKKHSKHKRKHKHHSSSGTHIASKHSHENRLLSSSFSEDDRKRAKSKHETTKRYQSESRISDGSDSEHHRHPPSSDSEDSREIERREERKHKTKKRHRSGLRKYDSSDSERYRRRSSSDSDDDRGRERKAKSKHKTKKRYRSESQRSDGFDLEHHRNRSLSPDSEDDRERKRRAKSKHKTKKRYHSESRRSDGSDSEHQLKRSSSSDSEDGRYRRRSTRTELKHMKRYDDSSDLERHGNRSSSQFES
ncbi:uncharacterized zinc finger CCHC domain-containing protein At4g19190 [Asparagus officinalis]|uniref:uncharacterized zinc finger CCHC domain-containing protein At4g19190 n=1 Tax=Asparagus officinalis TaxID=4686 RepID=UPI00098DF6A9|nr:uncharacterized zinc finger CCHC domain-containing protein At4g19190 [Asparagus officinalis]